ncbi:DUF1922 domain-containing protein [Candidatus Bathyarchaeota archaeon]|nr:DUF1922 domain-containing protein [Candidatus Bathyarchaeota archaeon]
MKKGKGFRKRGLNVTITHIVRCIRCGELLLAKNEQETRTCPYCGNRILIEKTQKVASAQSAYEASVLLRKMKEETAARKNLTADRGS